MYSLENLMLREYVGLDVPPPPGISLWLFAALQSCIWDAALHNKLAFSLKTLPGRRSWHLQPSGIFLKAEDVFCA